MICGRPSAAPLASILLWSPELSASMCVHKLLPHSARLACASRPAFSLATSLICHAMKLNLASSSSLDRVRCCGSSTQWQLMSHISSTTMKSIAFSYAIELDIWWASRYQTHKIHSLTTTASWFMRREKEMFVRLGEWLCWWWVAVIATTGNNECGGCIQFVGGGRDKNRQTIE